MVSIHCFKWLSARSLLIFMLLSTSFFNKAVAKNFPQYAFNNSLVSPSDMATGIYTLQPLAADYVLITDYGAIGDGNIANAGVNATAMANALATGKTVKIPYTAAGYHFGTNQITVGTGQIIEGESQVLLKSTATTSLFRMTGFNITSGISNVFIDMAGSGASSTAIRFGTNSVIVSRVRISKIRFAHCVEAIGEEVHPTNSVVDIMIEDCLAWQTRGRQIYSRRSRGFFMIRSTTVDFTQDAGAPTWEGIRIEDFAGVELERVDVLGFGTSQTYNAAARGIVINNGQALWLTRVFSDSVRGDGILISNISFVFSLSLESSLSLGNGIVLSNVSKGVFSNTLINGANGLPGAAAGGAGLLVSGCADNVFTNTLGYNCTGTGIIVNMGCARNTFANILLNNNLFGIAIQGTTATTRFNGGSMNGNGTTVSNTATGTGNIIESVTGY